MASRARSSDFRLRTSDFPQVPRFIFYGGKGGVGKTTCAAARAVAAAADTRVLVVSTDPAHSLGDALGVRLSRAPRLIRPRLYAAELDAPRAFARWLGEHRAPLGDILEHGTWLDREDVDALLDLSMPGIDELMGLIEIDRLAHLRLKNQHGSYDLVVVDTAPTGHTLRLLAAPDAVAAVAGVLDDLQQEHRVIREQLARVGRPEAADRLIALLVQQAHEIAARLRDARRTTFHWVTLPEDLSLAETRDAIAALERTGLRVAEIVVNRLLPDARVPCPVCDRRRARERRVVADIRRALGRGRRVRVIPAALREPREVKTLAKIGRALTAKLSTTEHTEDRRKHPAGLPFRVPRVLHGGERAFSAPRNGSTAPPESIAAFRDATLLFFGGKGGVGKTTVAAATAIRVARAHPRRRLLLLSTDPAHSLGDVFETPVGDRLTTVPGAPKNLRVRELDAAQALAKRRDHLRAALDEIAGAVGALSSSAAAELIDLAPPGIDELFGILTVVEARRAFHTIVVDTAPTGHALRLLEMPDAAREWVQVLLRVLLKYKSLVRPGQLASELVDLSKSIRALQGMLRDTAHTRFIVVTHAAEVPRLETERLFDRLRRLEIAAPAVVVNALTLAPGRCPRCRATAAAERSQLRTQRRACRVRSRRCVIIQTPLAAPPPRGVRALAQWSARWTVEPGTKNPEP